MAFSGGGANPAFKPFTMTAGQPGQQPAPGAGTFSFGGAGGGAPSAFSFGTGAPAATGVAAPQLSFTAATPAVTTTSSLFSFGGAAATPSIATSTPAATSFSFGSTGASAPSMPSFGAPQPTAQAAPTFGVATPQPQAPQGVLPTFGQATAGQPSALPSFGAPAIQPQQQQQQQPQQQTASALPSFGTTGQPTISFGTPSLGGTTTSASQPQVGTAAPISFTSAPPTTSTTTVLPTFGVPAASKPAGSILPTLTTTSAATAPISFGTAGATAGGGTTGFSFGASTGTPSLNLGGSTATTTAAASTTTTAAATTTLGGLDGSAAAGGTVAATTTTATASTSAAAAAAAGTVSQMNFRQLQEAINKWMLDLQEQEKLFLDQATKVNAWDRTLITNGDKIAKLNESISKVKNDHTRLEHALDYLKTQQQEFEAFLEPLEAGLPVNIQVEPEREQLYSLTENVDTQLQQMAEDLKEVIRHINESNKTVDKNDPVSQILRILNEHTDALQWVEDNASQVRRSLEDVSKQHQMAKREHERSLRQMFK